MSMLNFINQDPKPRSFPKAVALMESLCEDRQTGSRKCPHCKKVDMWLPLQRTMDPHFAPLIRCHCNHCGCEWNPCFEPQVTPG